MALASSLGYAYRDSRACSNFPWGKYIAPGAIRTHPGARPQTHDAFFLGRARVRGRYNWTAVPVALTISMPPPCPNWMDS